MTLDKIREHHPDEATVYDTIEEKYLTHKPLKNQEISVLAAAARAEINIWGVANQEAHDKALKASEEAEAYRKTVRRISVKELKIDGVVCWIDEATKIYDPITGFEIGKYIDGKIVDEYLIKK
jgi:hypothetical protein